MEIIQKINFCSSAAIVPFDAFDKVVELANDCEYSLTYSIYTKNLDITILAKLI